MNRKKKFDFGEFWNIYRRKPGSLIVLILVLLSAVVTVGVLFSLIIYILVNGVTHLKP